MSAQLRGEYTRQLGQARGEAEDRSRRASRISNLRLAAFAAGVVVAWLVFGARWLGPAWLAIPVGAFVALVAVHDRLIRQEERARRLAAFFERGLARLEDRWHGGGESGSAYADPDHPYAADLDLFGAGSLFELLCTARSRAGERTLARWLLEPADPSRLRARQEAVAELRPGLALRRDLATLGSALRFDLAPEVLARWATAPPQPLARALRVAAAVLPAASVGTLLAWWWSGLPPLAFGIALLAQSAFALRLRSRVQQVLAAVDLPAPEIELLSALLARLEEERFESPLLAELRAALDTEGVAPSQCLRGLRGRLDLLDARRNQLFAPFGALLLWTTQLALAIEQWRQSFAGALDRWVEVLGEVEALLALAAYAHEHPEQPFPEIVASGPLFEGEALGHPLLPRERCVANDVALGGELRVMVVSGSNMSGKSTLLRTVGANAVLALMGAPVCAGRLRISPLAIGAAIRVHDSLLEGRSRFYAEIQRLRRIVELAEAPGGALFLLDEILHGTNSHDRGIGAEAVVRALLDRGAVGLVTTHDLALARIADALEPRGRNVHFEDRLVDGEIVFDYRLRPGTVRRSNALELMRAVGLEV